MNFSALDTPESQAFQTQLSSLENTGLAAKLPKEIIEGGEKLADELFQLLLVELAMDLPVMVNRHVQQKGKPKLVNHHVTYFEL